MFLRFLADDGTGLVAPGTPIGSRNRGFSLNFLAFLVMGVQNILCFHIFSTKPRFFIEFFHSSCVLLFLSLFLSRRVIPEASDGSLWASFVGPGLPCAPPCWPFWYNSSTISAFSTFHNFADFHEFLKTHHVS